MAKNSKRLSRKKKSGKLNIITEEFVPARLPAFGFQLQNYRTSEYSFNKPDFIAKFYELAEQKLTSLIETTDKHSAGDVGDHFINTQEAHARSLHSNDIANNENQVSRIKNTFRMRKEAIGRRLENLREQRGEPAAVAEKYKDLHAAFSPKIGPVHINIGLIVTILCMAFDAVLNYSFMQTVVLQNIYMLLLTVAGMSLLSDGSMFGLGMICSRKDSGFMPKPLFRTLCIGFIGAFIISIVASVMVKIGSMETTFGTINAAGEFVGKDSYTLAEWGVTLATSVITTLTGAISMAFSYDRNAYKVGLREKAEAKLRHIDAEMDALENELVLLTDAPDPGVQDAEKRAAAEANIGALVIGLKQHLRKMMAELMHDANVTDRMSDSGKKLNEEQAGPVSAPTPIPQSDPAEDSSATGPAENGTAA